MVSIVPRRVPWGMPALAQRLKLTPFDLHNPMPKAPAQTKTPAPARQLRGGAGRTRTAGGQLESGQLPLDQLLSGYQRGAELLKFCRDKLEAVEDQIKVLDDGALKPWTQE